MVATEETAEFTDDVSSSMIPTVIQHNPSSYAGNETIGNEEVESNSNDFTNVNLESDANNNRPIQESNENQNAMMSNSGFAPARGRNHQFPGHRSLLCRIGRRGSMSGSACLQSTTVALPRPALSIPGQRDLLPGPAARLPGIQSHGQVSHAANG